MPVLAHEREPVLAAESGDPEVVRGNGPAGFFELGADPGVMAGSRVIDRQGPGYRDKFIEPFLVLIATTRVRDSEAVFAEDNHRHFNA